MMKKIVLIMCMLLFITTVSALDFDNKKTYDPINKEITITNAYGFGDDLVKIKLNTPHYNLVPIGYNKVAEIKYSVLEDSDYPFQDMEFFNRRDNMKGFNRDFDYKVREEYQKEVIDYKKTCEVSFDCEDLSEVCNDCSSVPDGSHYETAVRWVDIDKLKFEKGDVYTIGIFTEVKKGDNVEWIISVVGERINEWAVWTHSLNTGLQAYWTMNETTGTLAHDSVTGNKNMTVQDNWNATSGIIGGAYSTNGDSCSVDKVNMSGQSDGTFNWWMYVFGGSSLGVLVHAGDGDDLGEWYALYAASDKIHLTYYDSTARNPTDYPITIGSWQMVTMVFNTSHIVVYINSSLISTEDIDTPWAFAYEIPINNTYWFAQNGVCASSPTNIMFDEISIWNRSLLESEVVDLYNSGSGLSYIPDSSITPFVSLNTPSDNSISIPTDVTFNCSGKDTNNLTNLSLIIDGVSVFLNDSDIGVEAFIFKNETLTVGSHTWTCNTSNNLGETTQPSTRGLVVGYVVNNQTYNNQTTEGSTETFTLNFTTDTSVLTVSTVNLIYNNTINSFPYSTSGNEVIAQSSITIPQITSDVNLSFNWNVTFSDGQGFETSPLNQSVGNLSLDDCGTFTNLIYNFTNYDEATKTKLVNTTIEVSVNLYDVGKTTLLVNYSKKYEEENPAQVCLESSLLTTVNYSSYVVTKYYTNDTVNNLSYATEYYNILNQTISNTTVPKDISLYDLRTSDSTSFQLTFRDSSYVLAPNILVQVHRQYVEDNDFKVVEIPLTDSNGQTVLNLVRNSVIYNFIMVNEAREIVATFNSVTAFCQDFTIGQCTIFLNADPEGIVVYDYNEEFRISITTPTFSNTTNLVSLSFVTDDLLPKTVRMEVVRNNDFGNRSVCIGELTSASGVVSCDASSVVDSDQFLFVSVFVDGELSNQYTINLNADGLSFGTSEGAFYAFLLILMLITLFMEDKTVLVASLGIGWVVVLSLGLLKGSLIGSASAGIWLLVTIGIFLWKLNKEDGI